MGIESKVDDLPAKQEAANEVVVEGSSTNAPHVESEGEDDHDEDPTAPSADAPAASASAKKKKSKRKKIKAALTGKSGDSDDAPAKPTVDDMSKAIGGLSKSQLSDLLAMNPALMREIGGADGNLSSAKATEALKTMSLQDIMTGLAAGGKNAKDIGSYKFWQTQPVPKFDEKKGDIVEGPFKIIDPERVRKEPDPLPGTYEWVTMDLTKEDEMQEVYFLLSNHYVEDDESMFRFKYSFSFLKWYAKLVIRIPRSQY
jgi:glycylpeptide N-tetradecanoyltransferase